MAGPAGGAGAAGFSAGAAGGAGAGVVFCSTGGLVLNPCMTETSCCRDRKVRPREVSIKMTAAAAVSLARKGAAPVLPKTVWLEPPKAAPIPAPLPCCKSTMEIRARHTSTWMIIITVVMILLI